MMPGHHELPVGIDHFGTLRLGDGLAYLRDFAVANQDGAMLDRSMRNGEDRGVLDQHRSRERRVGRIGREAR